MRLRLSILFAALVLAGCRHYPAPRVAAGAGARVEDSRNGWNGPCGADVWCYGALFTIKHGNNPKDWTLDYTPEEAIAQSRAEGAFKWHYPHRIEMPCGRAYLFHSDAEVASWVDKKCLCGNPDEIVIGISETKPKGVRDPRARNL